MMNDLTHLPAARMLRPFILTSDKRLPSFRQFTESYERVAHTMLEPVLIIDDSNKSTRQEYHDLLLRLNPIATISYEQSTPDHEVQVRDLISWVLEFSQDDILFLVDNIFFSGEFSEGIKRSSQLIQTHGDIIVLRPTHAIVADNRDSLFNNFMYRVDGTTHFEQQCSVLSRRVIKDFYIIKEKNKTIALPRDKCWGELCEDRKYKIYETTIPYVRSLVEP